MEVLELDELEEVEPFDEEDVLDDELLEEDEDELDEGFAAVEVFESDRESVR